MMANLEADENDRTEAAHRFLVAAIAGDGYELQNSLATLAELGAVVDAFRTLVSVGSSHPDLVHPAAKQAFADAWIAEDRPRVAGVPAGRQLRRMFADDLELFVAGLRILIPPLRGDAPPVIYRGQSMAEREGGIVGFSWSPNPMLAEVYARHPGMSGAPSVVIAKFFPQSAIIGQVSHLEIIVDPLRIGATQLIYVPDQKLTEAEAATLRTTNLDLTILYEFSQQYAATH